MPPKISNKDPKMPKGRTSAYACYLKCKREECRERGEEVDFKQFSKKCAVEWGDLDSEAKSPYVIMAEKDKERYVKEMKLYKPSPGYNSKGKLEGGKKRRKRKEKDPNQPKRAMSGFMFFCQEKRPKLKEQNPNATVGELAKQLGAAWKILTLEQKKPFEEAAQKDRERYALAKEGFQAKKASAVVEEDEEEEEEEEEEEDGVSDEED